MHSNKRQHRQRLFQQADLYVVTSEPLSEGRSDLEILDAALAAGVRLIQLRDKHATTRELYEKAVEFRRRTAAVDALLIINDRLDIALAVDADGVHLGQQDLPLATARALFPNGLIGASSHSLEEALAAQNADADYVNIGPVFHTATKEGLSSFLGPQAISQIAPELSIPFTVMGGIKLRHVPELIANGAKILAVVTAVTAADDPQSAALTLRQAILEARQTASRH